MTSIFGLLAATFGYIGFLEEIEEAQNNGENRSEIIKKKVKGLKLIFWI